ncbi:hypothetical protein AVEN_62731-1 [Araneus ventricosus]|uniref:Uncharacterized protein n=1 Tax=Araneus ventricosus TaxID=182803 RepID=A0A4Y2IP40_ARAVE|nr:hypothetical protein AVEN_62731-1 [Araneus ventricosus]
MYQPSTAAGLAGRMPNSMLPLGWRDKIKIHRYHICIVPNSPTATLAIMGQTNSLNRYQLLSGQKAKFTNRYHIMECAKFIKRYRWLGTQIHQLLPYYGQTNYQLALLLWNTPYQSIHMG